MARRVREKEEVLNNIFDIEQYVIGLYDRITELEMQLKENERREQSMIDQMVRISNENESGTVRKMAIERGMQCFNAVYYPDGRNFEDWINACLFIWEVPPYATLNEVVDLCRDELYKRYCELLEEEQEKKENDDNE